MAPDSINLNSPAYSNRFPKISPKEYDQLGIVHLLPTGELDITMWEAIQDLSLIRELFLEGYLPKMEVTEGTEGVSPDARKLIPRLVEHVPFSKNNPCRAPRTRKRFLCPGKYMKLIAAEQLAGIKSSDQSHPVYHPSDPQISCLLLSQPYKNNLNLIKNCRAFPSSTRGPNPAVLLRYSLREATVVWFWWVNNSNGSNAPNTRG
jgi:hypothetical protein